MEDDWLEVQQEARMARLDAVDLRNRLKSRVGRYIVGKTIDFFLWCERTARRKGW